MGEIKTISVERTSVAEYVKRKRKKKKPKRVSDIEITAGVSIALNVVQSVIIYVLQAGPI